MHKLMTSTALVFALSAAASAQDSQEIDVSAFNELDIQNGMRVIAELGGEPSLRLEGDADDFELVEIDTRNGKLTISRDMNLFGRNEYINVTVYLTGAQVDDIEVRRGAVAEISGIDAGDLRVRVSTGAELEMSGRCGEMDLETNTGSSVDARALECEIVEASGSTGSSMRVTATARIEGRASMGSSLRVYGDPERRDLRSSMGGSVRVASGN